MKKFQTLKALFEIETVFKFQSDSSALHLFPTQFPTQTTSETGQTDTSTTSVITSFQIKGFNDLRM